MLKTYWFDPNATTTAITPTAYKGFEKFKVEVMALNEEGFMALFHENLQANNEFEDLKAEFQETYGFVWDPKIQFTAQHVIKASENLIAHRNAAIHIFAKILATSRIK